MKARDKLRAYWFKRERDMGGWAPLGQGTKSDLGYLLFQLQSIVDELDRRGYDRTTLKFSIEPKKGDDKFASQRGPKETE